MKRNERVWAAGYTALLLLVTALPYAVASQTAGGDWVFSGHLIGVEDGNSYLAKMLRGAVGDWLFRTPYTLTEQPGVAVFLPYLGLGKLLDGRAPHEQFVMLYHALRSLGVAVAVLGTYRFAAQFLKRVPDRRWVTVMATIGGGLGWLLLPAVGGRAWPELPLVFISPETFGFLAALSVPHLALARGLLLLALAAYLDSLAEQAGIGAAALVLLTALVHPISGALALGVIGLHQLSLLGAASYDRSWRRWVGQARSGLLAAALSLPYLGYLGLRAARDPFLQGWAQQNRILSPHLGYYALAWGVLLPLAWVGGRRLIRAGRRQGLLLVAWALALPALAYAPFSVQRRLVEGGWVVLLILAALALQDIGGRVWRPRARLALLALTLPGSLILLFGALKLARQPAEPAFLPQEKATAFAYLADQAPVDAVVLTGVQNGNALPAWAPVRVPVGHGPESVPFEPARQQVLSYFSSEGADDRSRLLAELGADYVLVGPAERSLAGEAFKPDQSLTLEFTAGAYTVYRVDPETR